MKWQPESQVLIQGITEPLATYYVPKMKAYGTNIVAGVSSGRGGEKLDEIPIFDLVEQAIAEVGKVETTLIFVQSYGVLDAALEAIAAGIGQIVIVTSGVPPLDMVRLLRKAQTTNTFILGSGSQGLLVPDKLWLGIGEPKFYTPGKIGLISRTDNSIDEVALALTQAGFGQSIAANLGTDAILGSTFEQWLQILEEDDDTDAIVVVGQANGSSEIGAAEYIASAIEKPVIVYLAGLYAPIERHFRDATTVIATQLSHSVPTTSVDKETLAILKEAKIALAKRPSEIPTLVKKALNPSQKAAKKE